MATTREDQHHPAPASLVLQSHRPIELVEAVKAHAQLDAPSKQEEWQSELSLWLGNFRDVYERGFHETEEALREVKTLAEVMSVVCFMNALSGVKIAWDEERPTRRLGSTGGEGDSVDILLDPLPKGVKDAHAAADVVVGTLLHELCHAMLRKYSCENKHCQDKACHGQADLETGEKGHGTAWSELASYLERFSGEFFGQKLSLDTSVE